MAQSILPDSNPVQSRLQWIWLMPAIRWILLCYIFLGVVLWFIPLFNILHAESSAVVALAAYFAAGYGSITAFRQKHRFQRVLLVQMSLLVVPFGLLTTSLIWAPNCGYVQGLLFYLLFPVITVIFSVGVAFVIAESRVRRKRTLLIGIGVIIVIFTPLYDIGLHPQFYVYNHVFGGILGPIYDEALVLRPGLFFFRAMTLLWAYLLYSVGTRLLYRPGKWEVNTDPVKKRTVGLSNTWLSDTRTCIVIAAILGLCYGFAAQLGINTTRGYLQAQLGGHIQTTHFNIYYDPASLSKGDIDLIAEDHEFRYHWLRNRLNMDVDERIESYLYPDPQTKARLTGARYTNVAPVWLSSPQLHIQLSSYRQVFGHELVHVFSRAFGLPILNASLSVGLVEGLAVALEPPDGNPTPHEQVSVAAMSLYVDQNATEVHLAEHIIRFLSPLGFWTGRGAVSYTTMGSFVRYLIETYGSDLFKNSYARCNFQAVYGHTLEALAQAWEDSLMSLPVISRSTEDLVMRRFTRPSLFEKRCPHYVPKYQRQYRAGAVAWANGDSLLAMDLLERSLERHPMYHPALNQWAIIKQIQGAHHAIRDRLDSLKVDDLSPTLLVRLGETYTMLGEPAEAHRFYETAYRRLSMADRIERNQVVMRQMLVDQPKILQILISGDPPAQRAEHLVAFADTVMVARFIRSLLLSESGDFEEAISLLHDMDPSYDVTLVKGRKDAISRRRLVWLAYFSRRVGRLVEAEGYALRAAQAYRNVGDLNEAERLDDFVEKMRWLRLYRQSGHS